MDDAQMVNGRPGGGGRRPQLHLLVVPTEGTEL